MLRDKAFRIGTITKTHGVNGQLNVVSDIRLTEPEDWPEWIFLDIDGGLVPFRTNPEGMIWRGEKQLIIAVNDCSDQGEALKLVGKDMWFPEEFKFLAERPGPAVSPMVGYILEDSNGHEIGRIDDFIDLPENPLFQIIVEGREILIPARAEWIINIDGEDKRIIMDLPDGLMDL
jgi:16S rRNA processing protein RimM